MLYFTSEQIAVVYTKTELTQLSTTYIQKKLRNVLEYTRNMWDYTGSNKPRNKCAK